MIARLVAAAALCALASCAHADTLEVQIGGAVTKYQGVVISAQQQNVRGLLQFGSTNSTTSETRATPPGVGSWTLVVDGEFIHDCVLVSSAVAAQQPSRYVMRCEP